ncbi:hypothetical protein ACWEQ2_24440 [Streptomyces sp. NPDC004096]
MQLRANDVVVPLEGVSDLKETVSSPIDLRGVPKVSAERTPDLGEHNDEVLVERGFSPAGPRSVERAMRFALTRGTGTEPTASRRPVVRRDAVVHE